MLRESRIFADFETRKFEGVLLGHSGYSSFFSSANDSPRKFNSTHQFIAVILHHYNN